MPSPTEYRHQNYQSNTGRSSGESNFYRDKMATDLSVAKQLNEIEVDTGSAHEKTSNSQKLSEQSQDFDDRLWEIAGLGKGSQPGSAVRRSGKISSNLTHVADESQSDENTFSLQATDIDSDLGAILMDEGISEGTDEMSASDIGENLDMMSHNDPLFQEMQNQLAMLEKNADARQARWVSS